MKVVSAGDGPEGGGADPGSTGRIPDILDRHDSRQFGLSGLFTRFVEPLTRRSEPGEQAAAIDDADIQLAKAHNVVTGLKLGNADQLVNERFADEDRFAPPFDLASATDALDLVIGVVSEVLRAVRHRALRWDVAAAGGRWPSASCGRSRL